MSAWLYLSCAILFEVAGTTSMKFADGFSRPLPSVLIFVFYGLAFVALTLAIRRIELGIAYAVWAGVGTAAIAIIGVLWFGEAVTVVKVISLFLVVAGVIGLRAA